MNDISLHIYDYHCLGCGYNWTHSEPIMRTEDGGYISLDYPAEFDKWSRRGARITCYQRNTLNVPVCYSCLAPDLPVGWLTQAPKEPTHEKRKEISDEELTRLLNS